MTNKNEAVLQDIAEQLIGAIANDETVDPELMKVAENLISSHNLYIQLLYVALILDRAKSLPLYFEAMDTFCDELHTEDSAEMGPAEKIGAVRSLTAAVKSQLDIVNSMLATKDASGVLIASLRDEFLGADSKTEEGGPISSIANMKPSERQRILTGVINDLRGIATKISRKDK